MRSAQSNKKQRTHHVYAMSWSSQPSRGQAAAIVGDFRDRHSNPNQRAGWVGGGNPSRLGRNYVKRATEMAHRWGAESLPTELRMKYED